MSTHSMLPASPTPNARAIDGSPMFTIDESSVVMNAAVPESAKTTHLLADSRLSSDVPMGAASGGVGAATWAHNAQATTAAACGELTDRSATAGLGLTRIAWSSEEERRRGENQEAASEGQRCEERVAEQERPDERAAQHGQDGGDPPRRHLPRSTTAHELRAQARERHRQDRGRQIGDSQTAH